MVLRADKGKATKLESEQTYNKKEEDLIQQGDYKKERKSENTLLENIRKKLKAELVKEQTRFLISSPCIAKAYLLCKVHKIESIYHPT